MFELGLSGRLWPIHAKPYRDEALSSWLARLSRAYGADPVRFCARVWPRHAVWNRDLDKGMDDGLLRVLGAKTATSHRRVLATTMRGYRGYLTEALKVTRGSPWLLRLGLKGYTRSRPWLQYCPRCLQADADPYFRRSWRLAFVTVCPKHHRPLWDRCGTCGAVVNFHCLPGDAEAITLCHHCRCDLRATPSRRLGTSPDDHQLIRFQTLLLNAMQHGVCRLGDFHTMQSALYFEMLHKRMQFFLTSLHAPGFEAAFSAFFDIPLFVSAFPPSTPRSIEALGVESRLAFMLFMTWWIDQHPESVMQLHSETNHQASTRPPLTVSPAPAG